MSMILRTFLENERGIKRYLSRFFSRSQDIDDLTQETFLRAFAESKREVVSPRAFLYRIARNLALNEKARHSHQTTSFIEDFPDPSVLEAGDQVSVEDAVEGRRKMAIFAEAISALPPQCRKVFILRKVEGLSQKDVAERLGLSVSTVEKHLATGLLKCSDYLRQHGYEVGGDSPSAQGGLKGSARAAIRAGSKSDV